MGTYDEQSRWGSQRGSDGEATGPGRGTCVAGRRLDESEQAAALELAHSFPGPFPIVIIGRSGSAFEERLTRLVVELQAGAPHRVRSQASKRGTFSSYRIEIYVETAAEAVARRSRLAELEGVLLAI